MVQNLFSPITIRETTIPNRVMVSPMCMYSCESRDGLATDWHMVHLGSRAVGGAGLVMTEATAVSPRGRITPDDLGIWSEEHADALRPITEFIKSQGSVPGIQLQHAGRKGSKTRPWDGGEPLQPSEGGWRTPMPSDIPWPYDDEPPEMDVLSEDDVQGIIDEFVAGAEHALSAGFEVAEIHAAHGYLLHQFLSPHTNRRNDAYGGSFENRIRLPLEVAEAVREVWPNDKPLFVRISATDWLDGDSWTVEQSVKLCRKLAAVGVDLIDVSAGALTPLQDLPDTGPGYQVPFAEVIREESDVPVGSVGGITGAAQADALVRNKRADLVIVGRQHLRDPYFTNHAAEELGRDEATRWPDQYDYAI